MRAKTTPAGSVVEYKDRVCRASGFPDCRAERQKTCGSNMLRIPVCGKRPGLASSGRVPAFEFKGPSRRQRMPITNLLHWKSQHTVRCRFDNPLPAKAFPCFMRVIGSCGVARGLERPAARVGRLGRARWLARRLRVKPKLHPFVLSPQPRPIEHGLGARRLEGETRDYP